MITKVLIAVLLVLLPVSAVAAFAHPVNERVVHWVDHTDSRFPAVETVHDWNPAPRVHFKQTNTCRGKRHCVDVYQTNLRPGYAGMTHIYRYKNGDIRYHIFLDTDPRSTYKRRSIVCHEFGHTVGIGHNGRGCMVSGGYSYPQKPGQYNLNIAR